MLQRYLSRSNHESAVLLSRSKLPSRGLLHNPDYIRTSKKDGCALFRRKGAAGRSFRVEPCRLHYSHMSFGRTFPRKAGSTIQCKFTRRTFYVVGSHLSLHFGQSGWAAYCSAINPASIIQSWSLQTTKRSNQTIFISRTLS